MVLFLCSSGLSKHYRFMPIITTSRYDEEHERPTMTDDRSERTNVHTNKGGIDMGTKGSDTERMDIKGFCVSYGTDEGNYGVQGTTVIPMDFLACLDCFKWLFSSRIPRRVCFWDGCFLIMRIWASVSAFMDSLALPLPTCGRARFHTACTYGA